MTTLNKNHKHTPDMESIFTEAGFGVDTEYTFCEECGVNMNRFWIYDDYDRLPFFTNWAVSR